METNATNGTKFRHVVSLGGTCRVAGLLRSYGLRDGSYPFDWNVGSPEAVLRLIETGFDGFLRPGSLVHEDGVVCDAGSGICMPNDFDASSPLGDQFDTVRAKYARRIERFQAASSEPTLFVRCAWDDEELDWLLSNPDEAVAILRRSHPANELVLLTAAASVPDATPLPVYRIDDPVFRRLLSRLGYPMLARSRNLLRDRGPKLLRTLRARAAVRTRARRLAARIAHPRVRRDGATSECDRGVRSSV